MMAQYLALADLSVGNAYIPAGTQFSDTGPGALVPSTYIPPTHAVSPLDTDAANKVWAAGPQLSSAQPWLAIGPWGQWNRWTGSSGPKFTNYWYRTASSTGWYLRGYENLGARSAVS